MALLVFLPDLSCAADEPARRPQRQIRKPTVIAAPPPPVQPPPLPPPRPTVTVKGLTGTLNKDDVHQTMDAKQSEFDACIGQTRRGLRWISGVIRFAFRVDAEGQVQEVHATESTIGHRNLEQCLTDAVAATVFPKPAGLATARFTWGMTVEPVAGRPPDPLDAKILERVLRKRRPELWRECEIRRRERFAVTAYIARNGRVLSAGAVPMPPKASEKLDCVLGEVVSWRMPKVEHQGKVSFLLR